MLKIKILFPYCFVLLFCGFAQSSELTLSGVKPVEEYTKLIAELKQVGVDGADNIKTAPPVLPIETLVEIFSVVQKHNVPLYDKVTKGDSIIWLNTLDDLSLAYKVIIDFLLAFEDAKHLYVSYNTAFNGSKGEYDKEYLKLAEHIVYGSTYSDALYKQMSEIKIKVNSTYETFEIYFPEEFKNAKQFTYLSEDNLKKLEKMSKTSYRASKNIPIQLKSYVAKNKFDLEFSNQALDLAFSLRGIVENYYSNGVLPNIDQTTK